MGMVHVRTLVKIKMEVMSVHVIGWMELFCLRTTILVRILMDAQTIMEDVPTLVSAATIGLSISIRNLSLP